MTSSPYSGHLELVHTVVQTFSMTGFTPDTSLSKIDTRCRSQQGDNLNVFTSFPFCQILGTLPFCECGRVFEDIRQVGGKRFSSKY